MAGIEQSERNVGVAGRVGCGNRGGDDGIEVPVEHQSRLVELRLVFVLLRVLQKLVAQRNFTFVSIVKYGNGALPLPPLKLLGGVALPPTSRELKRWGHQDQ